LPAEGRAEQEKAVATLQRMHFPTQLAVGALSPNVHPSRSVSDDEIRGYANLSRSIVTRRRATKAAKAANAGNQGARRVPTPKCNSITFRKAASHKSPLPGTDSLASLERRSKRFSLSNGEKAVPTKSHSSYLFVAVTKAYALKALASLAAISRLACSKWRLTRELLSLRLPVYLQK